MTACPSPRTLRCAIASILLAFAMTVPTPRASGQAQAANQTTARQRSPVAPRHAAVVTAVNEAYAKFRNDTGGKNADYIPELAKVNPKLFGIAVVTTDNQNVVVGDVNTPFSIQSIGKVFNLALAMQELGPDVVFQKIGSEPTGRPFNSVDAVVDLKTHTGNPLVNAGAIATTSLISGPNEQAKWEKIIGFFDKAAGAQLSVIDPVYKSESATNAGNKALAALLVKYERMYGDPNQAVDLYTRYCSIGVTAKQLATMGATLANGGVNPATGERVLPAADIPEILSAMTMAGLYDGSGAWAWHVGVPAKSGVGGGILAVVPGKGAIAVFAPPLDEAGNSVKAQKSIAYIANKLALDIFSPRSVGLK